MRQTVYIRISSSPWFAAETLEWVVRSRSGDFAAIEHGSPEQFKPFAKQNHVVLILPSSGVSVFDVELPGVPANRANRAIAYALEEQVADDIEDLHFIISSKNSANYRVAAVQRNSLQQVLDTFGRHGIIIDQVTAEQFATPSITDETSVMLVEDTALISAKSGEVTIIDAANLQQFGDALDLQAATLYAFSDNPRTRQVQPLFDEQNTVVSTGSPLPFLAELSAKNSTNFLQGAFAPVSQWLSTWKQWRIVAILAGILLALYIASKLMTINSLYTESENLDKQIAAKFKAILPGKRMVDPAIQIRREVDRLSVSSSGSNVSPLTLLEQVLPAINTSPSNTVQRIRFEQQTLILNIVVKNVADAAKIDQASKKLSAVNTEYSASTNANTVNVELKVTPAGGKQ